MTIQEFIEKKLQGKTSKRWQASVVAYGWDGDTTIYSYGLHYPLVKLIDGKVFINNAGYSSTTSKHIAHARSAGYTIAGDEVYFVPLTDGDGLTPRGILHSALSRRAVLVDAMDNKKRKDTQVYAYLTRELDSIERTIKAAKAVA